VFAGVPNAVGAEDKQPAVILRVIRAENFLPLPISTLPKDLGVISKSQRVVWVEAIAETHHNFQIAMIASLPRNRLPKNILVVTVSESWHLGKQRKRKLC